MSYIAALEHKETMRELRYVLMRFTRTCFYSLMGVGLIMVCAGVLVGLIGFCGVLTGPNGGEFSGPYSKTLLWLFSGLGLFFGGITIFAVGVGAIEDYAYDTYMPTQFIRTCPRCGEPLRKNSMNYFCPSKKCWRFLPMGLGVLLIRFFSKFTTYLNIAYIIAAIAFVML